MIVHSFESEVYSNSEFAFSQLEVLSYFSLVILAIIIFGSRFTSSKLDIISKAFGFRALGNRQEKVPVRPQLLVQLQVFDGSSHARCQIPDVDQETSERNTIRGRFVEFDNVLGCCEINVGFSNHQFSWNSRMRMC